MPDTHSMFIEYYCDAMLLIACAHACTIYGGNLLHAWQYLHMQHHQVPLQACSISTTLQHYIISMTMVISIVVSTAWSITILGDNSKRVAHLILTTHHVIKKSCEFPWCRNFLDTICRHPSSSYFFLHCHIVKKYFAQA